MGELATARASGALRCVTTADVGRGRLPTARSFARSPEALHPCVDARGRRPCRVFFVDALQHSRRSLTPKLETPKSKTAKRPGVGRILLWTGAGLTVAIGVAAFTVFLLSERRLAQVFQLPDHDLTLPEATAEVLVRGKHLAVTRGCLECHGEDGGGRLFLDQMPIFRLLPGNITSGGPPRDYSARDWERVVRHGVRPNGTPIVFMPSEDNVLMDDRDLGALVVFLRSLPAIATRTEASSLGPVGRLLFVTGALPLLAAERIDHDLRPAPAPVYAATREYGAYLAESCKGCHGPGLSGGAIPGVPPEWPPAGNLTADAAGMARYDLAAFTALMRTGRRVDGKAVDPNHMPWKVFASMDDVELGALYAFLSALPAKASGGR